MIFCFQIYMFASCQPDYIAGLSLLGGEPMEPENQRELLPFVRNFKALYPNKTVPMTFLTLLILFMGARKLSGFWREGHSSPQLEQSCVQFSLIADTSSQK